MSGKGRRRRGSGRASRGQSWSCRSGPLRELGLLFVLLSLLGAKLGWDSLADSSSIELLWLAGELGYHLAAAEEALGVLLP